MTTGNVTTNRLYNVPRTDPAFTARHGFYSTRVWSGGNRSSVLIKTSYSYYVRDCVVDTNSRGEPVYRFYKRKVVKYRERWRSKPNASNEEHDYTSTFHTNNGNAMKLRHTSSGGKYWFGLGGTTPCPGYPTDTWSSNDDLALLGKLREKIAGSDFDLSVFLGEGHQTLALIGDSAVRIAKALRSARKGDLRGAARILTGVHTGQKNVKRYGLPPAKQHVNRPRSVKGNTNDKAVASDWLELQYGWLPLVQDMYDGAAFLAQHCLGRDLSQRVVVRRTKKSKSTSVTNYALWDRNFIESKEIRAYLTSVNSWTLAGLADPSTVAWELMPWSFVADWAIPIGSYLQGRGLAASVTGTFVTTSFKKLESTWKNVGQAGYTLLVAPTTKVVSQRVTITRTKSTNLSVPKPAIKPLLDIPSWRRAANAVALLVQRR